MCVIPLDTELWMFRARRCMPARMNDKLPQADLDLLTLIQSTMHEAKIQPTTVKDWLRSYLLQHLGEMESVEQELTLRRFSAAFGAIQ